jgi:FkbM family methyltransferase
VPGQAHRIALREAVADHAIFWQCLVRNQYDVSRFPQARRLVAAYQEQVRRGIRPLIIDCGANIGLASVWFANQFPEAMIWAVEPDEANFALLTENTSPFRDRVRLLRGGVWSRSLRLRIMNPDAGSAAFRVEASKADAPHAVKGYTIAEICTLAGAQSAFIVKIDIEGAQKDLFNFNIDWVGESHLIALELDDWLMPWEGTSRSFFSCVSRYPFEYLISGETIFCFRDFEARGSS